MNNECINGIEQWFVLNFREVTKILTRCKNIVVVLSVLDIVTHTVTNNNDVSNSVIFVFLEINHHVPERYALMDRMTTKSRTDIEKEWAFKESLVEHTKELSFFF